MDKGDFCIGQARNDKGVLKTFLFKASAITKGIVVGSLEHDRHIMGKNNSIEIPAKDVIVNLGKEPKQGKVYGVDVSNIHRGRHQHEHFGTIHWFYVPEKEIGKALNVAFDKSYKILKHNRLDFMVQDSCIWEVLPTNGQKLAGMYKRSRDIAKKPHRLQIHPEVMPTTEFVYIILHELSHHLDWEFATSTKLKAAWLRLFNTTIKLTTIKKDKSIEILNQLLDGEDRPSDFKTVLSDEDTLIYKWILRTIQKDASLSVRELDILFEADYKDDIRAVWPQRTIPQKELVPVISEYATKNYRECFAEAVSFYLIGKKLPKNVTTLLDKTFSYCRQQAGKQS